MQPQFDDHPGPISAPLRRLTVLSLVVAGCVLAGWFVPYVEFAGTDAVLSDDTENSAQIAVFGPAFIAILASAVANNGPRRAAGLAAGAAAGVGTMVLIFVAIFYEFGHDGVFGGFGDEGFSYQIGFYLHLVAAIVAIVLVVNAFQVLQAAAVDEEKTVNPTLTTIGAVAIAVSALGMLLPNDGFGVLDIPSAPIKSAYLAFTGVIAIVGVMGFVNGRPIGAALGAGAGTTPLLMCLADALDSDDFSSGFFGTFTDGNVAIVAVGAGVAVVFGFIGMASSPATDREATFGDVPVAPATSLWGPAESVEPFDPLDPPRAVTVPPGWYPDPLRRHEQRYWDGRDWTTHVANGSEATSDLQ